MFEVTTVNRLAARKLLTKCGVRPEMGRTMSLRQLQEHLSNFVSLGTIRADEVTRELAAAQANQPVNAGAPWSAEQDAELLEHFRRGMSVATMANIRARTVGAINARLVKLGVMEYQTNTATYALTRKGKALLNGSSEAEADAIAAQGEMIRAQAAGNDATQAGQFADAGALAAMDAALAQEKRDRMQAEQDALEKRVSERIAAVPPARLEGREGISESDAEVRNTVNALTGRVGTLEGTVGTNCKQLAKLANAQAEMQTAIADTIAAEVKRVQGAWQRFEIATQDRVHRIEGLAHKAFPKLLRAVSARTRHDKGALNIWLYGPAGTGKSTAARKLAEAFSLAFHTNGPVGSQWDIRGFTDAQGKIVETAFRRAWEHGGVYCWDEGDGSAPAALIEANGALATGFASFPDKVVPRHPDCIVIINGNLRPGAAPDATYNGRYKQDTAFVNRFVAIEWGIDEDLERALLGKLDSVGEQWLKFVRTLRRKIAERGIKGIVVSPRQLQYGIALLDAGAELDEVMEQTVKFMFTDDQWKQVAA